MIANEVSKLYGLQDAVSTAVSRSHRYFARTQAREGYWWGELESNSTMEAEYLMLTHFLGIGDADTWRKLVNRLLESQREDGTWGQYYGSPGDLSASVECYFALKLAGVSADSPAMIKAREFIISKGGVPRTRVFTKIWLALFGQWDWKDVPTLPPEMALLPPWAPMNLYDFSSWARATMLPLSIVLTHRPLCQIPHSATIPELIPGQTAKTDIPLKPKSIAPVSGAFHLADRIFRWYNYLPWRPMRSAAIRRAVEWIVDHQEEDGSWGGIQPPWVYSLIALKTLGYDLDHPVMRKGIEGFKGFMIEEGDTLRIQACVSPVWDTCLAMIALEESGLPPDNPILREAGDWLIQAQVTNGGDWQVKAKDTMPGGWPFEFANSAYPDIDDTAEALIALKGARLRDQSKRREAIRRGAEWILGMQSKNGGWAAFDKDNTRRVVASIPFADFGEMIDPPSADVTAHVVEALIRVGYPANTPALQRAARYLWNEQEESGAWFGRWGVNYIYGTGAALPALEAIGEDMTAPAARRAVAWLADRQNEDGGWGESCASYANPELAGRGPSAASQTAWALLALMAAGELDSPTVQRGIKYLVSTQRDDGTWDEPWFTGAGFPGYGVGGRVEKTPNQGEELPAGFMIKYHLYRNYWPLMALGRFQRLSRR